MPIETSSLIALVAGSSVLAAVVTQGVSAFRDNRKMKEDGSFSALYLAIALEAYANECSTALSESENHSSSDGQAGSPHGNVPDLAEFPETVEWKAFRIRNATKAMSFRVEVETTKAMINGHWEFLDEDDVVPLVREETARLGQKALALATEFRSAWDIAAVNYSDPWNVSSHLDTKVDQYALAKAKRDERNRKSNEELMVQMATRQVVAEVQSDPVRTESS